MVYSDSHGEPRNKLPTNNGKSISDAVAGIPTALCSSPFSNIPPQPYTNCRKLDRADRALFYSNLYSLFHKSCPCRIE